MAEQKNTSAGWEGLTSKTFEDEDHERRLIEQASFAAGTVDDSQKWEQIRNQQEEDDFRILFGEHQDDTTTADEKIAQYGWSINLSEQELQDRADKGETQAIIALKMRWFRKHYSIINYSGKTFVHSKNDKGELEFQDFKSFKEFHHNAWIEVEEEDKKGEKVKKTLSYANLFLRDPHIKKYQGIEFSPGEGSPNFLNLWKGWMVEPKEGKVDLFLELVRSLTDYDEPATEYLLSYLAHILQVPEKKPETAIVMRSKSHGVGKGTLMKLLSRFTENYAHLTSSESLGGTFSGHLMDKIIAFLDENTWAPGDKDLEGRIKALISEPVISIRKMRTDEIQVRSYLRVFIASNDAFPVAIAGEDRRFFVVDCSDRYKGQTNPGEFFHNFDLWIRNGGDKAVMHYLMNRDISTWNPRTFPKTKARLEIQIMSLPPASKFLFEMLNGTAAMSDETMVIDGLRRRFIRNALYADMVEWCKIGRHYPPTTDEFGKTISRLLNFSSDHENWKSNWCKKVKGKNEYFYQVNTMAEAQERFAKNAFGVEPSEIFFAYDNHFQEAHGMLPNLDTVDPTNR